MQYHIVALVFAFGAMLPGHAMAQADIDRPGGDFKGVYVNNAAECQRQCNNDAQCQAWTFVRRDRHCMLKNSVPQSRADACCESGLHDMKALTRPLPHTSSPSQKAAPAPKETGIVDHGSCDADKPGDC